MDLAPVACSACGTPNEAGRKFCAECGSKLGVACPACGTINSAAVKFCGECGATMRTDAAVAPAPTAAASVPATESTAERRLVSVLFADLVGFTTLSEERDAEDTRELLTRYFDVARSVIERHGGTVEKFIGDAVMAVWGAPTAHEDDAERAVRAALELVAAVPGIADGSAAIQARAGVLTGEAAVTIGATNQGMVAGDLVNTASRLQSAAAPGTVLVGEATYHAASTSIAFEPAGEQTMKGKAAPVPAWRAIAVVARRGGSGRSELLEPPFVGRDEELRLLKDSFEATGRERRSRLISVIGQAGIGKTRLAWEFEKYLDGVVDTAYWHEGRSPSYGDGVSYWALVEMVRRRAGIGEGDDDETVRAALNAMLEQFVPDPAERRSLAPRLAGLLGIEELPSESREELFAAWRTFFQRMAEQAPVIMVFTDLQWADQGMLDFVESLLTWARNEPIFVVALSRPELMERRPDWGSSVRSVTRVTLEPLADVQIAEMLEGLVPGIPGPALRSIVERAEGIPLYAVETVRMLLDRELLVAEDGRYRLTGEIGSLGVAATLQALIASRLDAAQPEDRALLQDASVLGQSFTTEALAAVAGEEPSALTERLDRLVRRQLLTVDADPRSPERGQHKFVQAVVREVAYASLARPDRRARHLAAARHLEALGEEETAGVLASHYLSAHEASRPGPEADALAAQARVALVAAAERAAALHSNSQAVGYLEQTISITADPAEQAGLYLRAAELGDHTSDYEAAIEHARAARDLYRGLDDMAGVVRAATWMGRHYTSSKVEPQAVAVMEETLTEGAAIDASAEYAALLAELSRVYMMTGRHYEAISTADRALALAGPLGLVRPVVEALINKGTALVHVGRIVEGAASLRGAAAEADGHALTASALRARNNLLAVISEEDFRAAIALAEESYQLAIRLGNQGFAFQFAGLLAGMSMDAGEWGAWMDEIQGLEEGEVVPPFYALWFITLRARLAGLRGDLAGAAAGRARAAQLRTQLDSQMVTAGGNLQDAFVAFLAGDWPAAARQALESAVDPNFGTDGPDVAAAAAVAGNLGDELAEAIRLLRDVQGGGRWTAAILTTAEAGQAARQGRWDEARAGYRRALEARHDIGDLLGEALGGLAWGMLASDRDPEAAAAGAAAERFFTERGGAATVATYRAAFVPVQAARSAPGPVHDAEPVRSSVSTS
ncbi:MAG: AAA family ATPase [Chloroflexota bacterium]|nr:AAA family ATPase [Chloroflexota bacterium]